MGDTHFALEGGAYASWKESRRAMAEYDEKVSPCAWPLLRTVAAASPVI